VQTLDVPFVRPSHRLRVTELGRGLHRVVASFGYQETPDVPALLEACAVHGLVVDFERVTYFLGRDVHRLRRRHGPLSIPRRLFAFMARNAAPAVGYFAMPPERVVEIGLQYEM
jgi:KUP system potassium uptake protein